MSKQRESLFPTCVRAEFLVPMTKHSYLPTCLSACLFVCLLACLRACLSVWSVYLPRVLVPSYTPIMPTCGIELP